MKKIIMGLMVICTLFFMTNASLACDCGCQNGKNTAEIECPKDCDCGCQNDEKCKCSKSKCHKIFAKCKKLKKRCKKGCPLKDIINENTENSEE